MVADHVKRLVLGLTAALLCVAVVAHADSGTIDWRAAVTGDQGDSTVQQLPDTVLACPGCCSSHGGISSSCASNGHIYCNDGTASPTCLCSSCGVGNPTCTGGQIWTGSACECPAGQTLVNGVCTTSTCTGGRYWNGSSCVCGSGQAFISNACTTCTNGHVPNSTATACVCPSGQTEVAGVCTTQQQTTFAIGGGMSGNWYNAAQSGHGFQLEILKSPLGYASVFWFAFDNYRNQAWISGVGLIQGNRIVIDAARRVGAQFPPYFAPAEAQSLPWGTVTLTFSDCTHGHVDWTSTDPSFSSSGGMDLVRLTQILGTSCP